MSGNAATRDCNKRNLDADDVQIGLEVYRQHIAATTSGMELMGGGSKRLPCNVKNDEMDHWIWICGGLVIVFLTDTCHRLLSSVKGGREGEAMRERPRKAVELAIHTFSEILLAALKQGERIPKREESDQV